MRIATGALRPRNDTLQEVRCEAGRADRGVRPYGCVARGAVRVGGASGTPPPTDELQVVRWGRNDVGSELSAASGR